MLSSLVLLGTLALVHAQEPLISQLYTYPNLPYKVDADTSGRGPQSGYNICNSTTAGPSSLCQTSFLNSLDDFCLWAPPAPGSIVGDVEGSMVAWCTQGAKHGARQIPPGALTGVQFLRATSGHYVQITGLINQEMINMVANDDGGEMDSAGADNRGNPLGGLVYTTSFGGNTTTSDIQQVTYWTNFMGGGAFCMKACFNGYPEAAKMCQHKLDRIGCQYNAPADYADESFLSCDSDDQMFPGEYVVNGVTSSYEQPAESLGPIVSLPYQVLIPKTSLCTTFASTALFGVVTSSGPAATATGASATGISAGTPTPGSTPTPAPGSLSGTGTSAGAGATTTSRPSSTSSGATLGARLCAIIGVFAVSVGFLLF